MADRWEKVNSDRFYFLGLQDHHGWWLQPWNEKISLLGRKAMTNLCCAVRLVTKRTKKQIYHVADKGSYSQSYGFSSSHAWMWELDHKEGWVPKNWCFQPVVLEKTLESPLDSKVKPVNLKGNEPWIFIGRTDAEAPILWPPDAKSWLTGKDPDAGKD